MMRLLKHQMTRLSTLAIAAILTSAATLVAQVKDFQPLSNQPQETVAAPPLILAAYGFVWAAVLFYVWLLWRRIGRVERELADVNTKLAKRTR